MRLLNKATIYDLQFEGHTRQKLSWIISVQALNRYNHLSHAWHTPRMKIKNSFNDVMSFTAGVAEMLHGRLMKTHLNPVNDLAVWEGGLEYGRQFYSVISSLVPAGTQEYLLKLRQESSVLQHRFTTPALSGEQLFRQSNSSHSVRWGGSVQNATGRTSLERWTDKKMTDGKGKEGRCYLFPGGIPAAAVNSIWLRFKDRK